MPPDAAFFTDAPVRVDSGVVQGDTVRGSWLADLAEAGFNASLGWPILRGR